MTHNQIISRPQYQEQSIYCSCCQDSFPRSSERGYRTIPAPVINTRTSSKNFSARAKEAKGAQDLQILVLGPTGAGKSSFIKVTTGCDVPIGHSIRSCTTECQAYAVPELDGIKYTLVDTPGFDDSSRDDLEILKSIVGYLAGHGDSSISGIIYLHRITDMKMTGTSVLNLQMLKKFCGEEFYSRVALVSTMWNNIPNDELRGESESRERQLKEQDRYWGEMIHGRSRTFRFDGKQASGLDILRHFSSNATDTLPLPQLIKELRERPACEETSAGRIILDERRKREQKKLEEMEKEKADMEAEKAEQDAELMQMSLELEKKKQDLSDSFTSDQTWPRRRRDSRHEHSSGNRRHSWGNEGHARPSIRAAVLEVVREILPKLR